MTQVESLCSPEKADAWGSSFCYAGLLHYCPVPACDVPSSNASDHCSAYLDDEGCASCDYYLCKEAFGGSESCGGDGYYLRYGYKYCERFSLVTRPRLSPDGQAWLDEVRRCLMQELEVQIDDGHSCSQIRETAFASHPSCYLDAGFCALPWSDIWAVFTTVDPSDFELRQILSTGGSCLGDIFE